MAKLFNVFVETDFEPTYLGSYHAKTFSEAVRAALRENGLEPELYDKKNNLYNGYRLFESEEGRDDDQ